jgi:hypothetical protein
MSLAVPVYERQRDVRALPGARLAAPRADAYGAEAASAFTRLAERGLKMAEDLEDAETLERYNAFKRDVSRYHNDPEKGALNRVGKDTIGLYSEAETWMENMAEEYARKMRSPRMVQNFRRMAGQTILSQGEKNSLHEAKQIRAYREAEADATIQSALEDAAADWQSDAAFDQAFDTALSALELKTRGLGGEARKAALGELESRFATGRLSAMIQNDPMAAEAWYKEHKDRFTAAAREKAEKVLESETRAYKLEIARDGLIERHGMNYEAARKEILEKYQGDEERQVMSLYEAYYADERRIRTEAEKRSEENFFQKLQSFGSETEAMDYLLKNTRSMNGWQRGKSFVNWLFNGRKTTEEGALDRILTEIGEGKYHSMTAGQFKAKIGPKFSKEDFSEIVLPAFTETAAEFKTNIAVANATIRDDIGKIREKLGNDNRLIESVERRYRAEVDAHPEWGAEERLACYQKIAGMRILRDGWLGFGKVTIREAEARERETRGYYYDPYTNRWKNIETGTILED